MEDKLLFVILALTFGQQCTGFKPEDEMVVYFKEFQECEGSENNSMKYTRLGLNFIGNDTFVMDGELEVVNIVDGDLTFTMDIKRCKGSTDLKDAYEHVFDHKINNICLDVKFPGSIVKSILEDSGIPPKCPILPGNYHLTPKSVKLDYFAKKVVSPGFWKLESRIVKNFGKKDEKTELCFYCKGEVKIKETKTRNRSQKKSEKTKNEIE